jgi:hypothetical protein
MNERIRELVAEAGATLDQDFYQNVVSITLSPQELEEFAELIVRECAAMTRNLSAHGELAEKAVKEHFGVEE